VKACPLWNGRGGPLVQVIGIRETSIELRALCSAKNGPTAWDLSCLLREQLVAFVQSLDDGRYLPQYRVLANKGASVPNGQVESAPLDHVTGASNPAIRPTYSVHPPPAPGNDQA
jgi:hypothetical protein